MNQMYTLAKLNWRKTGCNSIESMPGATAALYRVFATLEGFVACFESVDLGTEATLELAKERCQKHYEEQCTKLDWLIPVNMNRVLWVIKQMPDGRFDIQSPDGNYFYDRVQNAWIPYDSDKSFRKYGCICSYESAEEGAKEITENTPIQTRLIMKTETFTFSFTKEQRNTLIERLEYYISDLDTAINELTDENGRCEPGQGNKVKALRKELAAQNELLSLLTQG